MSPLQHYFGVPLMPIAEDEHSSERGSGAIQPGGMGGNLCRLGTLGGGFPQTISSRKNWVQIDYALEMRKIKENKKQSPAPGSAVRDGARGIPGIPSPASPTAPGHRPVPGLKGLGRQGSVSGSLQTPVPRATSCPRFPPGQLRPLLSASGGVLSRAFA